LLRRSLNQVFPDPRVPLHPCLLHKEVDSFWILIHRHSAGWVKLACLRRHGVGCFIQGLSSVRTNLNEARGATRLGALVEQPYHVHEELPHRMAIER
jgi:hypothetical protein